MFFWAGKCCTALSQVAHNGSKLGLPFSPLFMSVNIWHCRGLWSLVPQVYHTYLCCWRFTSFGLLRVLPHQKLRSISIPMISFLKECFHFYPSWYFQAIDSTCYLLNLPTTTWFIAPQLSNRCTGTHYFLYISLDSLSLFPTSHMYTILWISSFKCLLAPLYPQDTF